MAGQSKSVLLADIGGTNARFALRQNKSQGPIVRMKVADYASPDAAIWAFLAQVKPERRPCQALLAVAGPVTRDTAHLTNGPWRFCGKTMCSTLNLERVELVNDFVAVAMALPQLNDQDLETLREGHAAPNAPKVVIGPGTGLGVAAMFFPDSKPVPLSSEAGHISLAAHSELENALLGHIRVELGHVAAEDVLSGPGLTRLYRSIATVEGLPASLTDPGEISQAAMEDICPICRRALEHFCALLGRFAGDMVLTFNARGGIYLAGGIIPSIAQFLKGSRFRRCFEDKGAFTDYMKEIPSYIVTRPDPAFVGLSLLAEEG